MDERIMQFRVGVMVLATLIIAAMLIVLFDAVPEMFNVFSKKYTVQMVFDEAPGVSEGTPVRKHGIFLGRVEEVTFDDRDRVVVTARIQPAKVKKNDVPRINASLLGDATIEMEADADPNKPPDPIVDGEIFQGAQVPDRFAGIEGTLVEVAQSVDATSKEWSKVGKQINNLLETNRGQVEKTLENLDKTLANLDKTLTTANNLIGDPQLQTDLKKTLRELPTTLEESRQAIATVQTTMDGLQKTIGSADRNLKNLEGFTRPLGEKGDVLVARLDAGTEQLTVLVEQLSRFASALNSSQGTLNLLLNDPQLYQHVASAVANIDLLIQQARPILNDARVFSDKIARHPEVLGVRGAMKSSSGIK